MAVRSRLRKLREDAGFKQASDFANEYDIPEPTYRSAENGNRPPPIAAAKRYAKILSRKLKREISWLYLMGETDQESFGTAEAVLVGEVGAGEKVVRFDDGTVLEGIDAPVGHPGCCAARIRGHSMKPLEPGWLVFYAGEHQGDPADHVNKLCAVGLEDGSTYIKKLKRERGKWRLDSWNADPIEDAQVAWASPIIEIRPR